MVLRRFFTSSGLLGFFVACSSSTDNVTAPSCVGVELLVAASDYSSSVVCGAPGCVESKSSTGADLGGDPQLTFDNGHAFYLSRDKDLLFEVDPTCGVPIKKMSMAGLAPAGRPANPHDVAIATDGKTLVVPLYNSGRLAFLTTNAAGQWAIDSSIDLAPFDADKNPQADAVRILSLGGADKAFVTLERLDDANGLRSEQTSQMLRVDVATRNVEATIELAGRNPFNPMAVLDHALFMAEPGNFNSADDDLAGIEKFDADTSTSKLLVRERDLKGSVAEIAVTKGCGVAIIAGPDAANPTALVAFDPESGAILKNPVLGPTPGYDLQDLAWKGGTLYVGDRRQQGGSEFTVHILTKNETTCDLTDSGRTISLPQRPVALRAARPPR